MLTKLNNDLLYFLVSLNAICNFELGWRCNVGGNPKSFFGLILDPCKKVIKNFHPSED